MDISSNKVEFLHVGTIFEQTTLFVAKGQRVGDQVEALLVELVKYFIRSLLLQQIFVGDKLGQLLNSLPLPDITRLTDKIFVSLVFQISRGTELFVSEVATP